MNILIITSEPFPHGGAIANRILSIAKGLMENKKTVRVLCIRPADRLHSGYKNEPKGCYENIFFDYLHGHTLWPSSKIKKLITIYNKYLYLVNFFFNKDKLKKPNVVINTVDKITLHFVLYILSKIHGFKLVLMLDEYPFYVQKRNKVYYYIGKIRSMFAYRFFDGYILISDNLIEFYKNYSPPKAKFFKMPMTVDPDRFESVQGLKKYESLFVIEYCGIEAKVDGVEYLLDAFKLINDSITHACLLIIGDNPDGYFNYLKKRSIELGIDKDVIFTGRISRDEIPSLLKSAKILVLPRPNTIIAHGGFPTKLGEYLMTGIPVICTQVGEIPKYLKHQENAFLCQANSSVDIANAILDIYSNYEFARKVGLKGKEICVKEFSFRSKSLSLSYFLNGV